MRRLVLFLLTVVFFGSCATYDQPGCEAGRQIDCACANDVTGYQVCLDDGSGWGDCKCPGCTSNSDCDPGYFCDLTTNTCKLEGGCASNSDCAINEYCDLTTRTCKPVACDHSTQCANKCCGDDGCGTGATCENNCPLGTTCNRTTCTCVDGCCPNSPANKFFVDISGQVIDPSTGAGAGNIGAGAISPMEALTLPNPTLYSATTTAADGSFALDCFDVTSIALGAVVLTDDPSWDNTAGALYPTGTGVVGWSSNAEKVCTAGAVAFALSTNLVETIGQLPDVNPDNDGFVMGMVVGPTGRPVGGAVIKIQDPSDDWVDPLSVYYPDVAFQNLSSRMTTSSNGLFILPASNFYSGIAVVNAEKTGMTFTDQMAAPKGGFVYFLMISQNDR
ncbi:MAG: hypothetical protein JRJ87_23405 [Deltaproteobacteria bacterium]|nr:hypothetical protein [Deltaproteobacteria bacterium]